MGIYSRYIFPWMMDTEGVKPNITRCRQEAIAGVSGDVLEIGFGTGLSLPHYPPQVRRLTAIDVNPGMSPRAQKRLQDSNVEVEHLVADGQSLPLDANSFDSAVSNITLCSIPDLPRALSELRRVLKPGGRFHFLEHGLSDEPKVQKWQHRLTPLWKVIGDGCHLNRNIAEYLEQAGFEIIEMKNFYLEGEPRLSGYMYQGVAAL